MSPEKRKAQVDAIARIFYGIIAANPEIVQEAWEKATQEYVTNETDSPEDVL